MGRHALATCNRDAGELSAIARPHARCYSSTARKAQLVREANSGRQALKLLETVKPALVLIDVNLPDMSGLDVTRQIKSDPRHSGVKVIQISATFGSPRDQLHGLEVGGADVYIAEPVQRGTLLSVINRLLGP